MYTLLTLTRRTKMNRAQKKQKKNHVQAQAPSSYYGLSVDTLIGMLKHTAVMYRIANPADETETLQNHYLTKKDNHVLAMCNEKLKLAAAIVRENEHKLLMNKQRMMYTTEMMNQTDTELTAYETVLSTYLPIFPNSTSSDEPHPVKYEHSFVPSAHEKEFNEMSIDELIYLYWQVDESDAETVATDEKVSVDVKYF